MIIGNVRGAHQMLPNPDWKAVDQRESQARSSVGNNNGDDNQGGDMPCWMSKEESNREETKNRDSKKKLKEDSKKMLAQLKKNANHATQDVKVQEGITEEKCIAGPVLTRLRQGRVIKSTP